MSSSLGRSFGLSSYLKEEVTMTKKQGIVSILEYDSERTKSDASLKRTLSADMSSEKWLSQHGFFLPLKKISSSDGFQFPSIADSTSSEEDGYEERHQVEEKKKEEEEEAEKHSGNLDVWGSILSQKAQEDSKNLPPPYIHPLVKRSASSMRGKNLEICTESLGSETGSGGFSSYPPSETGDAEEDKEEEHHQQQQQQKQQEKAAQNYDTEDWQVAKYKFVSGKKTSPRSFPPPIPFLSSQDGTSLHMRSRRDNGRLVLEAVSVASQNNFRAQRLDGRLVLTFINKTNGEEQAEEEQEGPKNEESKVEKNEADQFELELDNSENETELDGPDDGEEEETEEDVEEDVEEDIGGGGGAGGDREELRLVMELAPNFSSGNVSFHRLALMMNKSMLLANRNPTCPKSVTKTVNFEAEEEEEVIMKTINSLTQSLPPRPPLAARMIPTQPKATVAATAKAAASLNAYEYYRKSKAITVTASVLNAPIAQNQASTWNSNKLILSKNIVGNEQHELLVLRGNNGDYFVPFFKGCKEPRRSLLFLENYCIATS